MGRFYSSKENEDTSEMISKSVMDHLDKNDLKTPNDLTVVVNSNSDISKPKIKVDGIDKIEVDVQIPDENESNVETKRKITVPKAPGSDRIDVEKLDSAVKEVLEDFDSSKTNEDISEMISSSLMDHLDKNDLLTPNDFTVVIEKNSDISKPKIKVDGIDEIEVDVQIPNENGSKEGIKRKISIPTVPGTDTIDVEKLDSALKEVLELIDAPEVFPNNEEISEMITKSVMDFLDINGLKETADVTLVI